MSDRLPEKLQEKLKTRLRYYEDLGIAEFFRDRVAAMQYISPLEEPGYTSVTAAAFSEVSAPMVDAATEPTTTLFAEPFKPTHHITDVPKIGEGTLLTIREDIGDCIRCKLHKGRTKLVFGDGHPQAKLLFIGEGPGRDEDLQGLPFVGRAGKLLTQMIEAMGLRRSDVYICNVVKCRPPDNRAPEKDEVAACSPFLFRQIDLVAPKVIVCLGSIAAQTILETTRGISQ